MNNQTAGVRSAGPAPEDLDALRHSLREQRAFRREQLRRLSGARTASLGGAREEAALVRGREDGADGAASRDGAPAHGTEPAPATTTDAAAPGAHGPARTASPAADASCASASDADGSGAGPSGEDGPAQAPYRPAGRYGARAGSAGAVPRDRLAASARMVLADVEAALARMDQGRYGSCQLCAHPIALDRLTVVPQARYCGRCQHVREAGR